MNRSLNSANSYPSYGVRACNGVSENFCIMTNGVVPSVEGASVVARFNFTRGLPL